MKPRRVQLSRRKGWRMPANAVKVDRTTRWGNPFMPAQRTPAAIAACVDEYRNWLATQPQLREEIRRELHGKHLACWCPLDGACHADVMLEVANS